MANKKINTKLYIILPIVLLFLAVIEAIYISNKYNTPITSILIYSILSLSILWIFNWGINIRFVVKIPKHFLRFITIALHSILIVVLWWIADSYLIDYFENINLLQQNTSWTQFHQCKTFIIFILIFGISSIDILLELLQEKENTLKHQNNTESLHKEAELYKLRQQFNAHFIFNTLNAINALVKKQPDDAKTMLVTLSEYLRSNIKKEDDNKTTLADELKDLSHYLSIEKYRFANRLRIIENIEESCLAIYTPPFIIQPLIENAIKFGLYGTLEEVIISLTIKKKNNHLEITIINPFDPTGVMPKGTGFGLSAVRRRLYLLYQQNNLLQTEIITTKDNNKHQFKAVLMLPVQK